MSKYKSTSQTFESRIHKNKKLVLCNNNIIEFYSNIMMISCK